MKVLKSFAYFVGYFRRRMLRTSQIISLMALAFVIMYAIIHLSGLSVEVKKADIVLWYIN